MAELREDPITGVTTLFAPGRSARPGATPTREPPTETVSFDPGCPFCPGNERETPPELARTGSGRPGQPGWRVRAFPNKYPIVEHHEVVVLSPAHDLPFARLGTDEAAEALTVLRDRTAHHVGAGAEHVAAWINHGKDAGASRPHPHAQLAALPAVPPGVVRLAERFRAAGRDLLVEDRDRGFVIADGDASAWCPAASGHPYEVVVALNRSPGRFDTASGDEIAAVAAALRGAFARLERALGDPPSVTVVHSGDGFPWHVRIAPRIGVQAGFEDGTGYLVNPVRPEDAAATLRGDAP